MLTIHAIQTGTVAVRTRQVEGVGRGARRLANTLLDRTWTEPLPILAFAIEHPEGVIVVDTGETARVAEPGYFPRWHPYFRLGVREWVQPEEEIGPQLERLGIAAGDVRLVVLTHLHTDHAGGLRHFPDTEILVTRTELARASGFMGLLRGYPSNRFPAWFSPRAVELEATPFRPFPESLPLTSNGDVLLVPAAGHTPGHVAVVVQEEADGEPSVVLAGDSSYTEDTMLRGAIDGVAPDEDAARLTLERMRAYAGSTPTVYLPAHDPESARRLAERRVVGEYHAS